MNDLEKIRSMLMEVASASGSLSVQTLTYIMRRLLKDEPDMTVRGAKFYLRVIAGLTLRVKEAPDYLIYKGRFSEALYDEHYLRDGRDAFGVYTDLMGVLRKLDATYQDRFSIESAQRYSQQVTEDALLMVSELEKNDMK